MRSTVACLILCCALFASTAWADETFPDVQYVPGKAGFDKKVKGTLTLTATELRFTDKDSKPVFGIPLGSVKEVTNSVEQNPGSTGAKIMLGVFASKKEEFLYVKTETDEAAEAVVFKVKNKTSPAIVAKVEFQVKKAKDQEAAARSESKPATVAGAEAVPPRDMSPADSLAAK